MMSFADAYQILWARINHFSEFYDLTSFEHYLVLLMKNSSSIRRGLLGIVQPIRAPTKHGATQSGHRDVIREAN